MTETLLRISLTELCQFEGIDEQVIVEVVEYGIAKPMAGVDVAEWVFDTSSVHWIKKAIRLNQDLEIDWVAVAMVVDLLRQKERLQQENEHFRRQLERFLQDGADPF